MNLVFDSDILTSNGYLGLNCHGRFEGANRSLCLHGYNLSVFIFAAVGLKSSQVDPHGSFVPGRRSWFFQKKLFRLPSEARVYFKKPINTNK